MAMILQARDLPELSQPPSTAQQQRKREWDRARPSSACVLALPYLSLFSEELTTTKSKTV